MPPPERFERDYGCTEAEWLGWLPGAVKDHALSLQVETANAEVRVGQGLLRLHWHALPPRRIALLHLPRLAVAFAFEGVADGPRAEFMAYFDLYMQRGGG